jgi:PKD repeat protein
MDLMVAHVSTPVMMLFDDFSDGTLDDWTIFQGSWDASAGYLQGHGSISTPAILEDTPLESYGRWEYDFQLKRTSSAGGERQRIRNHFIQIDDADARYSSGYYVLIESYNFLWWTFGSIELWRWDEGSSPSGSIISNSWSPNTNVNTVAIERDETGLFRLYVNNQLLGSGMDNTYTTNEFMGFRHSQNLGDEGDHIIYEIRVEVLGDDNDHNLLTWNASSDDPDEVNEYVIYRSEDYMGPWDTSNCIDMLLADGSDVYEYYDFDKGLADDIYWWYVVRAVGKNGLEEDNTEAVNEPGLTNIPPVASFNFEPMNPFVLQTVYFNSTSYDIDGYIVNWTWDMDDETIMYGEQVTHEFESSAHYEVTLTVTDNGSVVRSVSKMVFVASGEEIVDIEQNEFDRGFRLMPGWDGYQEFIPSMDMLSRVELYMTKSGSPTGEVTVQIREDDANGAIVFEGIISPDDVSTSFPDYVWVSIDIGAVPVTSENTYVIVLLSPDDGAGTHHNLQCGWCDSYPANSGGPYEGGWFYFRKDFSSSWSFVRDWDFTFQTYGYL